MGLQPLKVYSLTYGFSYHNINQTESEKQDADYNAQVHDFIDSAKMFYATKEFQSTYDHYNTASTFLGGMSNEDNLEAAIIFSKIAAIDHDEKYSSIALDFLNLLALRDHLTKKQLFRQPAFKILQKEQRWMDMIDEL
jgi:hypothetical protein